MNASCPSLATAVACRLEWERLCGRKALLDEASLVRAAAEFTQAQLTADIVPEYPHPDVKDRWIDLVAKSSNGKLVLALEAKWIDVSKGQRLWDREVGVEIARLQHLTTDMAPGATRFLLVAGSRAHLRAGFLEKHINTEGRRLKIADAILPTSDNSLRKYSVRKCDKALRNYFISVAKKVGGRLPSSYDAQRVGHFAFASTDDAIECFLWSLKRPKGWGAFRPESEWLSS